MALARWPSILITECRIGEPRTGAQALEYWILALEAGLGAIESLGIPRDLPEKLGMEDVER